MYLTQKVTSLGLLLNLETISYVSFPVLDETAFVSAVISLLGYFAIFIHYPVPNDSNELCILSHTDVTGTAETSVLSVRGFRPIKKLV